MFVLLITLLLFTRLDGHAVYVNPGHIVTVQGAGQLGYPTGTLINTDGGNHIVRQNINEVVQTLRGTK